MRRSQIIGFGSYLPQNIVTNDDLAEKIDTSDEWIRKRTGIAQRHIAADGELTSDIATNAARAALKNAGLDADAVDLIVLATATPDNTFPATATRVQSNLGIRRGAAFDVQAVCAGYVYALTMADNMIRLGQAETAIVIGAEVFSRILDWEDRGTCSFRRRCRCLRPARDRNGGNQRGYGYSVDAYSFRWGILRYALRRRGDRVRRARRAICGWKARKSFVMPSNA